MKRLIAFAVVACLAATSLRAEDPAGVDAKTKEILKKVGALHKDAKNLHADVAIETTAVADGEDKPALKAKAVIDLKAPNMFSLRSTINKDANMGVEVVSDGKNLVIYARRLKQYTETKAPGKLAPVGQAMLRLGPQTTGMLFQNVLADDPMEALLEGVTKGEHAGMEKVGDQEAHHMRFEQPGQKWELWVASKGEPFVLKAKSVAETGDGKMTVVETYTNWKLNTAPEKDPFEFKAPEGAKKVDRLGARGEE